MRATLARCVGTVLLVGASCMAKSVLGPEDDPALMGGLDLPPVSIPPDLRLVDARLPEPVPDLRASERDRACTSVRAEAMLTRKAVDIIVIADNSDTMTDELVAVERNINNHFADVMARSGLDYRLILLSHHGVTFIDQSICIPPPLSGNPTCSPPPLCPMAGARFYHYSIEIGSTDSLRKILSTYNSRDLCGAAPMGWSGWLRPDAFRVFIEITEHDSDTSIDDFETQLFARAGRHFGDATNRNYVFHTIAGLKENAPPTRPWGPTDPIQMTKCTRGGGAASHGLQYQLLSVRTGGMRFPICEHQNFHDVFHSLATGVVAGARIHCDFPLPPPPPGQMIDMDTVRVEYQPGGGGPVQMLRKVAGPMACGPGAFYIQAGRIVLCPETCNTMQGDGRPKVQVVFDCALQPS